MLSRSVRTPIVSIACMLGFVAQGRASTQYYENCTPVSGNCPAVPIPDASPGNPGILTLYVPPDPSGGILITRVDATIWVTHAYQGDLRVELVSPAGTVVALTDRPGQPQCGFYGFSTHDFGGLYYDYCLGFNVFAGMRFADGGNLGPYDPPNVACPGLDFGGTCCLCTIALGGAWQPQTPLSAFNGESKVGNWMLRVSDWAAPDAGNIRYLGLNITSEPLTPPIATITAPTEFSCACNPTTITGSANDPDGTLQGYVVEYSQHPGGPWSLIASSTTPVSNGTLATWNTTGVPEGYKFVRLTATNSMGISSQFATVLYVDQSFAALAVNAPAENAIVGGLVCPHGGVGDACFNQYTVKYAAAPACSPFNPVDPAQQVYTIGVSNDDLAHWNTLSGPAAVADGDYCLRVLASDSCGHTATVLRHVTVDNTPPVAQINTPIACTHAGGIVTITGTASDAHLSGWALQFTGGPTHGWTTIASGSTSVTNGFLASWNVAGLPTCAYTVRLLVSDSSAINCATSSNSAEYTTSIDVGPCCDINRDGLANGNDVQPFVSCMLQGVCP